MAGPTDPDSRPAPLAGGQRVPRLTKVGAATILIGLLADVAEHILVPHLHDALVAGIPVGEHLAHLLVFIGMSLVLAGVVADGARPRSRPDRHEGSPRNAVR